jgi:fibronectin type 3 domain-containing protein
VGNVADKDPVEIARVRETRFTDPGTEYGGRYRYTVAGVLGEAVSETSAAATIVPEDRFAPAAPQGLTALAGATAVQLSWERGTEPDIAFYRVYQAAPDGEWRLIAPRLETATYSHASAANRPPSQLLRYAVTAVDRNNNESEKSQTVEVPLP